MPDLGEKMKETVQPHVPEPVIAVGVLQPAGTWGSMAGDQVSGLLGMVMRRNANKRAGGLGKDKAFRSKIAVIAVTQNRVYAFNANGRGRQCDISDKVGDWDRGDVKFTTTPGKISTKYVFDVVSTGAHYELETNALMTMGGESAKEFAEAIKGPLDQDS